jgi:hypothetical protein
MAYYKDFTVCDYFDGSMWTCRLMAIGWIEHSKSYPKGNADPLFIRKVNTLRANFRDAFPDICFRGLHCCTLCKMAGSLDVSLDNSHINLFIPLGGLVFVAPGRIDHYLEAHNYLPPESFMRAVMDCPSPLTEEYREKMRAANRGQDAPLFRDKHDCWSVGS